MIWKCLEFSPPDGGDRVLTVAFRWILDRVRRDQSGKRKGDEEAGSHVCGG